MKLKKSIIIMITAALFSVTLSAQDEIQADENQSILNSINWFTTVPQSHTVGVQGKAKNYHSFNLYTLNFALLEKTDMKELNVASGIEFCSDQINLTNDVLYTPTIWEKFSVGARLINHCTWNFGDFFEYDFIPGVYFSHKPVKWFSTDASVLFHLKSSFIYDTLKSAGPLISTGMACELAFNFEPLDWFKVKASISSFDFFRYYLFFAPDFKLETEFKVNEKMYLTLSADAQFVDFFTLSANFSSFNASITASWRF